MKIKFILFLVFAAGMSVVLSSYRSGAAYNYHDCTGAEGVGPIGANCTGSVGCSSPGISCHNASTSLNTIVELDSAGVAVTTYHPGGTYTIKISAVNGTGNTLPKFGFQLATVLATGAGSTSAVQAGIWGSSLPTNVQKTDTGSCSSCSGGLKIPIIEQSTQITATSGSGGSGTTYSESIPWTAPAAGSGSFKIYGSLNAVVGNDNQTQDYYQAATAVTITEASSNVGINELSGMIDGLNIYPTLMNDKVTVAFNLKDQSPVTISLISMDGKLVSTLVAGESVGEGSFKRSFEMNGLSTGVYLMRVQVGNSYAVSKVVKQ